MERHFKERLVGATLLVMAGVIIIPWLLDGKTNHNSVEQELVLPGNAKHSNETRTISLDASNPGGSSASSTRNSTPGLQNQEPPEATSTTAKLPVIPPDKSASSAAQESQPTRPEPAAEQSAGTVAPGSTADNTPLTGQTASVPASTTTAVQQRPAVFEDSITVKAPEISKTPPKTAPVPQITSAKAWAVQVGSFSSQDNAERLAERLKGKNYKAFVMRNVVEGKVRYRVRVGPVGVRAEADLLAAALKEDRQPAKVLSHP